MIVIVLGLMVLMLCAQGCLLSKSGENGWKILIPVYGGYLLYKACDSEGLFFANLALSILGMVTAATGIGIVFSIGMLVVNIIFYVRMAKAFGKSGGFATGMVFLPFIFLSILAFGDAQYQNGAKNAAREAGAWVGPEFAP